MNVYLTILVGTHPDEARPILATSDDRVVRAAVEAMLDRLGQARPAQITSQETEDVATNPSRDRGCRDGQD